MRAVHRPGTSDVMNGSATVTTALRQLFLVLPPRLGDVVVARIIVEFFQVIFVGFARVAIIPGVRRDRQSQQRDSHKTKAQGECE
jgi:hypothetical protein